MGPAGADILVASRKRRAASNWVEVDGAPFLTRTGSPLSNLPMQICAATKSTN